MSTCSRNRLPLEVSLLGIGLCLALASNLACGGEGGDGYAHKDSEFELLASPSEVGLSVTVTPVEPWKMNLEYPYSSIASPESGDPVRASASTSTERFVFEHAITPGSERTIPVRTRFAVCIEELCKPIDHAFAVESR